MFSSPQLQAQTTTIEKIMNHRRLLLEHLRQAPATLLLTLAALALFALPTLGSHFEFTFKDLQWQGAPGAPGQLWKMCSQWGIWLRVAGSNWLHWSSNHLFWDVAMFYVVGSFCERRGRLVYLSTMAVSALAIPISVALAAPELGTYRGLSGIDTALFALLATELFLAEIRRRDWAGSLLFGGMLIAMALKIGFELHSQHNLFVIDHSFVPVPLAHLVGAILGAAFAALGEREQAASGGRAVSRSALERGFSGNRTLSNAFRLIRKSI